MLKIKLLPGQNIWFTSDTHYYHLNLCRGTTKWRNAKGEIPPNVRNFETIHKHNDTIVNNINSLVKEDDILITLGDWSFNGFERIKEFRDRVLCKNIYLITGNHDEKIVDNKDGIRGIFTKVFDFYTQANITLENGMNVSLVLCHFPICSWDNMAKGVIHLFGHVHLPPEKRIMDGRSMDVGMDGNNLEPINLKEILKHMGPRTIAPTVLPQDHHAEEFK